MEVCVLHLILEDLRQQHGALDLNLSQTLDVFKLLTLNYPRYPDSMSRDAVEAVGMELIKRDELRGSQGDESSEVKLGVVEQILGWLSNEVARLSKGSPRSVMVFVPVNMFSNLCIGLLVHMPLQIFLCS